MFIIKLSNIQIHIQGRFFLWGRENFNSFTYFRFLFDFF